MKWHETSRNKVCTSKLAETLLSWNPWINEHFSTFYLSHQVLFGLVCSFDEHFHVDIPFLALFIWVIICWHFGRKLLAARLLRRLKFDMELLSVGSLELVAFEFLNSWLRWHKGLGFCIFRLTLFYKETVLNRRRSRLWTEINSFRTSLFVTRPLNWDRYHVFTIKAEVFGDVDRPVIWWSLIYVLGHLFIVTFYWRLRWKSHI
jgi:hypothetical protein